MSDATPHAVGLVAGRAAVADDALHAGEFRFLVRSADQLAVLDALRRMLAISYVDNPEHFELAAAVAQRGRELTAG